MATVGVTPNIDYPVSSPTPALHHSSQSPSSQFVYIVCQHGTEAVLKQRWLNKELPYRLAFSRPGLLTFKVDDSPHKAELIRENSLLPRDILIRQSGFGLGQVRGSDADSLVKQALEICGTEWKAVHVFARDPALPGTRGFEPGPTELTQIVEERFREKLPHCVELPHDSTGTLALDVVLVEPDHWLLGYHQLDEIYTYWPGGVYPVKRPPELISRAYLKMAEAIAWSGFAMKPGDAVVEIGSSPGGACQKLLDLGLRVVGIDPAEMDPAILSHPRFEHWQSKSAAVKRKRYSKFRWLAADANVAPNYTLDAVEDIVTYPTSRFKGLLLTVKLSSYDMLDQMDNFVARIQQWGFPQVKIRQLSYNRRECCVAASR